MPGIEVIDVAPLLEDRRNVLLMFDGGGIIFIWHEPGVYEVHTNFLPSRRGSFAALGSLAAYRWMFSHTDCVILQTRVPAFNAAAARFCALVGATLEFERKAVWPTKDGAVDMSFWTLRYEDWLRQTPAMAKSGEEFHRRLTEEFARHGIAEPHHADEFCHDLHVGAASEMIYGGQSIKAAILYNRWARFAGYAMISIITTSPPVVIDIGDAVLQILDGTFKVVKCRAPAQPDLRG